MIIAADESIMPQTLEHFNILNLLGVSKSIIVITKIDLVDDEWLKLVEMELKDYISGTNWEDSPIISLSNHTKAGLQELISTIDRSLNYIDAPKNIGFPKIYIDRSFSVKGFGTVITGTLINGSVRVGDELEVMPQELKRKFEGIQAHQTNHEKIDPGTRVALICQELKKMKFQGDLLVKPDILSNTFVIDASFDLLEEYPNEIKHNLNVTFHVGSRILCEIKIVRKRSSFGGK